MPLSLRSSAGELELLLGEQVLALPGGALEAVLTRYGAPFDETATVSVVAKLELGEGAELRHVRHLAGYDVVARDYLVIVRDGQASSCAMAHTVAEALVHLGEAAQR
ncbi:MAG: hypothetical protein QM756_16010 [Polyangiaceae bacterium]